MRDINIVYVIKMKFRVEKQIFETHRDLKVGVILVKGMDNSRRISSVESLLRGACAQRKRMFEKENIQDLKQIRMWRRAYEELGVDTETCKAELEKDLIEIEEGQNIKHENALVDMYKYFSIRHIIPMHGVDLDWLFGDLKLTFTNGGEPFRAEGGIRVDYAKEGEVAYMDNGGVISRIWNCKGAQRSKITGKTVNAGIIIDDMSRLHMDEFKDILRELQNSIIKYIGGYIEPYILRGEETEVDLGVEGRRSADDSKVPQQEKAYFLNKINHG